MCFTINRLGETRADPANVGYSGDNEARRDCPNQRRRSFNRGHGSCVAMYPEHLSLLFAEGSCRLERIHLCAYPILALQGAGQGDRLARERDASSTSTSSLRNSPAVNTYSDRHASPYAMIKAIDDAHYSSILAVHAAAMLCGAWAAPSWDTSSTAATIERASVHLAG